MRKFTRLISLILLGAMMITLIACDSGNKRGTDESTTTVAETTIDVNYEPISLESGLDYGGKTIRLLTEYENESVDGERNCYAGELTVDELRSEPINDSVYNRELQVEDLLNVEIERIQTPTGVNTPEYVTKTVNAGISEFEIVAAPAAGTMWSAQYGLYYDLNTIDNLDLESVCWSQEFTDEASFGNKVYFCTGDFSLSLKRSLYVVFYNKKLAEDYNINSVYGKNLYSLVNDGQWTIDTMTELAGSIYFDTNGNSEKDSEDVYGFSCASTSVDPYWSAFDIDILSKNSDDFLEYTPDIEKFGIAVEKVNKLFHGDNTYVIGWGTDDLYKLFMNDQALFTQTILIESERINDMSNDYGILPIPKYDEAQKGYYTCPSDQFSVFGIPITVEDTASTGAVLEALGWYSYRYVTPAYFDVAMKNKYSRDHETREMLDLILAGFRLDAAWLYAFYLADYPQLWRYLVADNDTAYASKLAEKEKRIVKLAETLNAAFESLET